MDYMRILLILLLVIGACCVIGTWSGLKDSAKGLIDVFRRD